MFSLHLPAPKPSPICPSLSTVAGVPPPCFLKSTTAKLRLPLYSSGSSSCNPWVLGSRSISHRSLSVLRLPSSHFVRPPSWPARRSLVACAGVFRTWRLITKGIVITLQVSSKITFPISVKQPNGRFETQTKICLSISNHHPEHWQPSWSVWTALVALIAFMPTNPNGPLGSLNYKKEDRLALAIKYREAPPKFGSPDRQKMIDEIFGTEVAYSEEEVNLVQNLLTGHLLQHIDD